MMNKQERKNLLVFGYGLPVIICVIVWLHTKGHFGFLSYLFLSLAVVILILTAVNVQWIKPLYTRWMVVAHFIGTIVTALILSVLFFCVFGVVGIILRIMKKDLLDRAIRPDQPSYWIKKEHAVFQKIDFERQF